jgi:hypothetical protein
VSWCVISLSLFPTRSRISGSLFPVLVCLCCVSDGSSDVELGNSLSVDVLCEEARYRVLKLRDAAMILRPRLRAEELSL